MAHVFVTGGSGVIGTALVSRLVARGDDVAALARSEVAAHKLPRPLATAGATMVERSFRLAGRRPPVCREMVRTLLHGHRYDGSRAERELGLRYTSARDTLVRTVEWARTEGLLRPPAV